MKVSTAVILAAGRGMRLGDDFRDRPKGFIDCQGSTLVQRSLAILRASGIERVLIVTGHCADYYDDLAASSGGFVTTLFNQRYADNGSLVSLTVALDAVKEPFLILDSDIVYERRAIPALLDCPMENAGLVSGTTDSGDEYYAWADEVAGLPLPAVRRLSKHLSEEPDAPWPTGFAPPHRTRSRPSPWPSMRIVSSSNCPPAPWARCASMTLCGARSMTSACWSVPGASSSRGSMP